MTLIPIFIGLLFIEMPMTWSQGVTLVNIKAKSHNVRKCLKMQFKFARSLTYRASTLWARSRLIKGTSTSLWQYYLSKWVEAKALPTNDARVVCKFLKSLFARFGTPHAIISDRGNGYPQKDKNKAKTRQKLDKTEHEIGKS
ncbi:reverse transcriptase domain-containing protein, partial [Tanacetum coccineum]